MDGPEQRVEPEPLGPRTRPRAARVVRPAQIGVSPEGVATGQATPEPRCRHAWEIRAAQKWRWRIDVHCRRCGYHLPIPGRFWRERDVRRVVEDTLARMERESDLHGP